MKKLLKNKRNGNIADIIGTAICLLSLMIVFISFVHFCAIIEYKRQLNDIARDYLLKVETTGELTVDEMNQLTLDINDIRPENVGTYVVTVNFNGDNTPARYGEDVSVSVNVVASYDALGLTQFYGMIKDSYEFSANYESTSKQ